MRLKWMMLLLFLAVLVPSLSRSRMITRCELKSRLEEAIKLPVGLERFKESLLSVVICELERMSNLNTSMVRTTMLVSPDSTTTTTKAPAPAASTNTTTAPAAPSSTNTTRAPAPQASTNTTTAPAPQETTTTTAAPAPPASTNSTTAPAPQETTTTTTAPAPPASTNTTTAPSAPTNSTTVPVNSSIQFPDAEVVQIERQVEIEALKRHVDGLWTSEEEATGGERRRRRQVPEAAMANPRSSPTYYGVFQLSDKKFCFSSDPWTDNFCITSCSAFIDDDITNDVDCFVKTQSWMNLFRAASSECFQVSNYFDGCN